MFDNLYINVPTITIFDLLFSVLIAFLLGLLLSIVYRFTYKGYSYSPSFVTTLIIISMVTALVIMVIGNNLARAFGLVGAMSIIRFRTAVKDTRDIAFVFFALGTGLAAGSGNYMIALAGTMFGCILIVLLFVTHYGESRQNELLLKFSLIPQTGTEAIYLPVFKKYLSNQTLLNIKTVRLGQLLEVVFQVRLKNANQYKDFVAELSSLEGVERISLVFGEEAARD